MYLVIFENPTCVTLLTCTIFNYLPNFNEKVLLLTLWYCESINYDNFYAINIKCDSSNFVNKN